MIRTLFITAFVIAPALAAAAQVDPYTRCATVLSCSETSEGRYNDPLGCLRKRSTVVARTCKASWVPVSGTAGSALFAFPFVAFTLFVLWGAATLKPRMAWLRGAVAGSALGALLLTVDAGVIPHAESMRSLVQFIAFPVKGIHAFAPVWLASLGFYPSLIIAHAVVYSGAVGLASSETKGAGWYACLFISAALALSIYDTLLV